MAGSSSRSNKTEALTIHERYVSFPSRHEDEELCTRHELFNTFVEARLEFVMRQLLRSVRRASRGAYVVVNSRGVYTRHTSVYNGTAGILVVLVRYLKAVQHRRTELGPNISSIDESHVTQLLWYILNDLEGRIPPPHGQHDTHHLDHGTAFYFGLPGLLLTCALAHRVLGNSRRTGELLHQLIALAPHIAQNRVVRDVNEVLYGRAGYLLCLSFVKQHFLISSEQNARIEFAASTIATTIVNQGRQNAVHPWPLMWRFHHKAYLGAAHGVAGILHALLAWSHVLDSSQRIAVASTVDALAHLVARPCSSSLHTSTGMPRTDRDETMHWCHGPAGHIMLFSAALHQAHGVDDDAVHRYQSLIEILTTRLAQRGLIRKGLGLCHGVSGTCYAFLAAFRATRHTRYLRLARAFYHIATTSKDYQRSVSTYIDSQRDVQGIPDTPFSLMEGTSGEICLLLDFLHPLLSSFPGFEFGDP